MTMTRAELHDAAAKAFGDAGLAADADASWSLIAELGFLMLAVPDEQGGLGLGRDAVGAVHTEFGRALVRGPAIAQMLVIEALTMAAALVDSEDQLAAAMGGTKMTAPLILSGPVLSDDGSTLSGKVSGVADADQASHVLVVAEGRRLAAMVPLDALGVSITAQPLWDETRRLFGVEFDGVAVDPAWVLASGDAVRPMANRLKASLSLMLAADSLGGASALLDLTIEYLKTRRQFDRPLALFQALKHRVADMKVQLTVAQALFWARAGGDDCDALSMGSMKAHAVQAYCDIAEDAVQLHGGIGLTSEYYCHLFQKRALLNAVLGGDADFWAEAKGRSLLAAGE